MRIIDVRAAQPPAPGAPAGWRTQLGQILVQICTDTGLSGIGVGGGGAASIHLIETVLRDSLMDRDASEVEGIHRDMCDHTVFYGRKGLAVMAISGIDLALWDLRGKAAGQPVVRMLNPKADLSRAIPTYLTVFDDQAARQAVSDGHTSVKLHVERFGDRPDPAAIATLVSRTRSELGEEGMVMVDAFTCWDVESTLRVGEAVARYDVAWIEEPLPPDRLEEYETLVLKSPVPIAGGEHEYLADGFKELIDRRLHAVLQPDINWCGGLTTLVEVFRLAKHVGLAVCPHRGAEPFALHAIAALSDQPLAESPRTWFNSLRGAPRIQNGFVRVSDAPGFGVSVDDALWQD